MRHYRYIMAVVLSALLFLMAGSVAFAQTDLIQEWNPTQYAEKELNAKTFCTMQTEYPIYKTGTKSIFLLITNRGSREILFGDAFALEKKEPDGWYTQALRSADPNVVLVWKSDAYNVSKKTSRGDFANFNFPLAPGEYRVIKSVFIDGKRNSEALFCAYFQVTDSGYDAEYLSGYAPLASLPENDTMTQIIQDGVFYMDDANKAYHADHLLTFLTKVSQGVNAKLRVAYDGKEGGCGITDYIYLAGQPYFMAETRLLGAAAGSVQSGRQAPSISRRYHSYLSTMEKGGNTMLVMTDWIGKPIEQASDWAIVYDVNAVGKSKIASLLHKIYGKNPEPDYRVYGKDPHSFVAYSNEKGTHKIRYTLTGKSLEEAVIIDSRSTIKNLLSMDWVDGQTILLVFSTVEQGVTCEITFDTALKKTVDEKYSE